jgi:hypothetical protein
MSDVQCENESLLRITHHLSLITVYFLTPGNLKYSPYSGYSKISTFTNLL